MRIVKKIFFLEAEEVEELCKKDSFISKQSGFLYPCFELEDGEILYPKTGGPATCETWYSALNDSERKNCLTT